MSEQSINKRCGKDSKVEVGCYGDVSTKQKKENLPLKKWLVESQAQREENNKKTFDKFIKKIDLGEADPSILNKYTTKVAAPNLSSPETNSLPPPAVTPISSNQSTESPTPQIFQQDYNQNSPSAGYNPANSQYWVYSQPYHDAAFNNLNNQLYYYQQFQYQQQYYFRQPPPQQQQQHCACLPSYMCSQPMPVYPFQSQEPLDFDNKKWIETLNDISYPEESKNVTETVCAKDEDCK